jgi:hypothetical protein
VTCNLEKRSKVAAVLRANPNQPQAAPAPGVATKKDKRHGGLDTRNHNSNYDTTSLRRAREDYSYSAKGNKNGWPWAGESRRAPPIIDKRETLNPDRRKMHFELKLTRKKRQVNAKESRKTLNLVAAFQSS